MGLLDLGNLTKREFGALPFKTRFTYLIGKFNKKIPFTDFEKTCFIVEDHSKSQPKFTAVDNRLGTLISEDFTSYDDAFDFLYKEDFYVSER